MAVNAPRSGASFTGASHTGSSFTGASVGSANRGGPSTGGGSSGGSSSSTTPQSVAPSYSELFNKAQEDQKAGKPIQQANGLEGLITGQAQTSSTLLPKPPSTGGSQYATEVSTQSALVTTTPMAEVSKSKEVGRIGGGPQASLQQVPAVKTEAQKAAEKITQFYTQPASYQTLNIKGTPGSGVINTKYTFSKPSDDLQITGFKPIPYAGYSGIIYKDEKGNLVTPLFGKNPNVGIKVETQYNLNPVYGGNRTITNQGEISIAETNKIFQDYAAVKKEGQVQSNFKILTQDLPKARYQDSLVRGSSKIETPPALSSIFTKSGEQIKKGIDLRTAKMPELSEGEKTILREEKVVQGIYRELPGYRESRDLLKAPINFYESSLKPTIGGIPLLGTTASTLAETPYATVKLLTIQGGSRLVAGLGTGKPLEALSVTGRDIGEVSAQFGSYALKNPVGAFELAGAFYLTHKLSIATPKLIGKGLDKAGIAVPLPKYNKFEIQVPGTTAAGAPKTTSISSIYLDTGTKLTKSGELRSGITPILTKTETGLKIGKIIPEDIPSLKIEVLPTYQAGNIGRGYKASSIESFVRTDPEFMRFAGYSPGDIKITQDILKTSKIINPVKSQAIREFPKSFKTADEESVKIILENLKKPAQQGKVVFGGSFAQEVQTTRGYSRAVGDLEPYATPKLSEKEASQIVSKIAKDLKKAGKDIQYTEGSVKIQGRKSPTDQYDHLIDFQFERDSKTLKGIGINEADKSDSILGLNFKVQPIKVQEYSLKSIVEQYRRKAESISKRYTFDNEKFISPGAHRLKDIPDTYVSGISAVDIGVSTGAIRPVLAGQAYEALGYFRKYEFKGQKIAGKINPEYEGKVESVYAEFEKNRAAFKANKGTSPYKLKLTQEELLEGLTTKKNTNYYSPAYSVISFDKTGTALSSNIPRSSFNEYKVSSPSITSPSGRSPSLNSPFNSPSINSPTSSPSIKSPQLTSPNSISPSITSPSGRSPSLNSPSITSPKGASPNSPSTKFPSLTYLDKESKKATDTFKPKKRTKGFDVFLRKRRKIVKVNVEALTKEGALSLGSKLTGESAAATFFVKESRQEGRKGVYENYFKDVAHRFKLTQKGDLIKGVERNKFRINTPGELRQITKEGQRASQLRAQQNRITFAPTAKINRTTLSEIKFGRSSRPLLSQRSPSQERGFFPFQLPSRSSLTRNAKSSGIKLR